MASSERFLIFPILEAIVRLDPASVLDVGVGTGKWGRLIREYLDVWKSRIHPSEWKVLIHGVEAFRYQWWGSYAPWYSAVFESDAVEYLERAPAYEVIVAVAVLEHLEREAGEKLLNLIERKTERAAFVAVPHGYMEQGPVGGNDYERHRSAWMPRDFRVRGWEMMLTAQGKIVAKWVQK